MAGELRGYILKIIANIWQSKISSISGIVIAALTFYTVHCPTGPYMAAASLVLGLLVKDPHK